MSKTANVSMMSFNLCTKKFCVEVTIPSPEEAGRDSLHRPFFVIVEKGNTIQHQELSKLHVPSELQALGTFCLLAP